MIIKIKVKRNLKIALGIIAIVLMMPLVSFVHAAQLQVIPTPLPNLNFQADLGIGNTKPVGAATVFAYNFWQGNAIYTFVAAGFTTPYLTSESQLDNWNYVLYGTARVDKGVTRSTTSEIQLLTATQRSELRAGNYFTVTSTYSCSPMTPAACKITMTNNLLTKVSTEKPVNVIEVSCKIVNGIETVQTWATCATSAAAIGCAIGEVPSAGVDTMVCIPAYSITAAGGAVTCLNGIIAYAASFVSPSASNAISVSSATIPTTDVPSIIENGATVVCSFTT